MNMHVPQSITTATELKVIASLLRQIISPRLAGPIISLFQDSLTGIYRISQDVTVPEHIAMNILARMKRPLNSFPRKDEPVSGLDIISRAFPLLNYSGKVKVENGKLIKGSLDGDSVKGLIHTIYSEFGPDRAGEFINACQAIVTKFNMFSGFSAGPSDLIATAEVSEHVKFEIQRAKDEVADIMSNVHEGKFLNNNGRSDGEELEQQIMNRINTANSRIVEELKKSLNNENRIYQMAVSKSKGSIEQNMTQMMAFLGQQNVEGKRVQNSMDNRTLPHFAKFDDGLEAHGFVENSFISGIRPAEFFFHAMGGREGLIDTAVKTSDSGYIQRKLVKLMEDTHVEQDGTVRDINGAIVQFAYGEDGIDSTAVEFQPCPLSTMTMEQVYAEFASHPDQFKEVMTEVSDYPDMIDQILKDREMLVKHVLKYDNNKIESIKAPVNLKRLVQKYANPYSTKTDLTPTYVVEQLNALCNEPYIIQNRLFHILLRFNFAPKKSILVHRFTKVIFDELCREIRMKYIKSRVHAGEMVGPLAAQSIGEPTTQLTLNTFHNAGTAAANATAGVPRLDELLRTSQNPKTPSNIVYFAGEIGRSQDAVTTKMKEIQKTTLRDITKSVRIYYDPNPLSSDSLVQEDRDILLSYEKFSIGNQNCASPWIVRLELDSVEMMARRVNNMTLIQTKIQNNKLLKVFDCVHTELNKTDKVVMRITFGSDVVKNALSLRFIEDKLLDTVLTGVEGIGRAFPTNMSGKELEYDDKVGGYRKADKLYTLITEGTNLLDLFVFPEVDFTRTYSNDIHEVLDVFGIETARMCLYTEINKVFEREKVDYHHLSLLVDTMTYQGRFVSIDRFGMNKMENGVLAKCSFEMTSKVLFDAAISGGFDTMRGISANIMFGQRPPCGTGLVDILIDETRLPEGSEQDIFGHDIAHANALVEQEDKKDEAEGQCRMEDIMMAW